MNKYIIEQLNRCKVAKIPPYTEETTNLVIQKGTSIVKMNIMSSDYYIDSKYEIYVDDSLVKPGNWYNTIHGNWNNGVGPSKNGLKVIVTNVMGKMIRVKSLSDTDEWEGWLPITNIKKIKEID